MQQQEQEGDIALSTVHVCLCGGPKVKCPPAFPNLGGMNWGLQVSQFWPFGHRQPFWHVDGARPSHG